ncbi:MAG: hypothetical protein ACXAEF_07960 [Candidatus Thorarchaeota archaeon]|jgi:ABC-type antimicrobial peptide transport system permease subunit
MGKGSAILGLILIILGLLPILNTMFLATLVDLSMILTYFNLGIYSLDLAGYLFTEVMLILLIGGIIVLIAGAMS